MLPTWASEICIMSLRMSPQGVSVFSNLGHFMLESDWCPQQLSFRSLLLRGQPVCPVLPFSSHSQCWNMKIRKTKSWSEDDLRVSGDSKFASSSVGGIPVGQYVSAGNAKLLPLVLGGKQCVFGRINLSCTHLSLFALPPLYQLCQYCAAAWAVVKCAAEMTLAKSNLAHKGGMFNTA